MSYELTAEILNFGAFLGFMCVNLAAFWKFGVQQRSSEMGRCCSRCCVAAAGFYFLRSHLVGTGDAGKDHWKHLAAGWCSRPRRALKLVPRAVAPARSHALRMNADDRGLAAATDDAPCPNISATPNSKHPRRMRENIMTASGIASLEGRAPEFEAQKRFPSIARPTARW